MLPVHVRLRWRFFTANGLTKIMKFCSCKEVQTVDLNYKTKCLGHPVVMEDARHCWEVSDCAVEIRLVQFSNRVDGTLLSRNTFSNWSQINKCKRLVQESNVGRRRFSNSVKCLSEESVNAQSKNLKNNSQKKQEHQYMQSITKSSVVVKVKDLEEHLRIKGYSTLRWGIGILVAVVLGIYMFREPIKENLSDEVADVASRSLGDQSVVLRANEVSKAIVNEILNDTATATLAVSFVTQMLKNNEIIEQAKEFVAEVLTADDTRENVVKLATSTLRILLAEESTRALLLDYVKDILLDQHTVNSCKQLLDILASDQESKEILADFFKQVLSSDTVTNEAVSLGKSITHEIVIDKKIQEETGNALWDAVVLSFTPKWMMSKDLNKH